MMDREAILKAMRSPIVLAIIIGSVLVFIIWLVAVFLPQGSKVSKLNAQAATLQSQQNALNARLIQLKRLNNSNLQALHRQYSTLVPPAPDTAQYLKQINATVGQAGVKLNSITLAPPAAPAAPAPVPGQKAVPLSAADTIAVELSVAGTYDQNLRLIQLIYNAPRLTTINQVSLVGGGATTNRGTILTASYVMTIYELPNLAAAPTTTTTAAA
jgi:Tfp pilus assembly protein PilN